MYIIIGIHKFITRVSAYIILYYRIKAAAHIMYLPNILSHAKIDVAVFVCAANIDDGRNVNKRRRRSNRQRCGTLDKKLPPDPWSRETRENKKLV